MIVTIHQPCYLPWAGYLQRMAQADVFVLLDHVQFERSNYQNRTRIRVKSGAPSGLPDYEARWLTVPVLQRSQKERILDKEIDNRGDPRRLWSTVQLETLRRAYRNAPYFDAYFPQVKQVLETPWTRLVDLDAALLQVLRAAFGIATPIVRSSELGVLGAKSELVLGLCQAVGARTFLGGMGGSREYMDRDAFARAGIEIQWQAFRHPVYPQRGTAPFIAGLSALDMLMNCGPESRYLIDSSFAKEEAADTQPERLLVAA